MVNDSLTIAIIAGLGGMFGWGFADFFAKKTIDVIGDMASLVWAHAIASGLLGLFLFSQLVTGSGGFPVTFEEWNIVFFFGVLQALVYILVYKGFAKGQLGLLSPVFSSYAGIAAILSILLFSEVVTGGLLLGLGVVFIGILITSLDPLHKKIRFKKHDGLYEILAATVLAAIWTVFWAQFISGKDWKVYASLMYISMAAFILVYSLATRASLKVGKPGMWKFLIGIGLGEILAYVSVSYGFSATSRISVVAVLSGALALPVLFLSAVFLKEKIALIHRVGSVAIIAGIAIISLT